MNLKKAYIYLASFLSLVCLFTVCYYLSYQHALKNFNNRAIERDRDFSFVEHRPEITSLAEEEKLIAAGTQPSATILPSTRYIVETYNKKSGDIVSEAFNPPGELVGLTKEEVEEYLSEYMLDLTLSEYNKGLLSFELLAFSDQEVTVRKSYDEELVPYRFYVAVKNGFVVIYNSDLKSVYKYTHIDAKHLPEEDRIELSLGIYLNNEDELYSLLESYSS